MRILSVLVLAALFAPGIAAAATLDEVKEQIKWDKATLKDDKKDLADIRKLRMKWEKAREKGNGALEGKVDTDLATWVKAKLAEGREEVEEASEEAGVEPAEPSGKPHSSGTEPQGKPSAHPAPQPAQSDDESDLEAEKTAQRRLREIAESLKEMQPSFSSGAAGDALYSAKSAMLEELQKIAAREVSRSEKELAEDKAQLDRLKGN